MAPSSSTYHHTARIAKAQDPLPAHPFEDLISELVEVTTTARSFVGEVTGYDVDHSVLRIKQFVAPYVALIPLSAIVAISPARDDDTLWGLVNASTEARR